MKPFKNFTMNFLFFILFCFVFFGECIYITYQIKNFVYMCVYIIKKCVCIYMMMPKNQQ